MCHSQNPLRFFGRSNSEVTYFSISSALVMSSTAKPFRLILRLSTILRRFLKQWGIGDERVELDVAYRRACFLAFVANLLPRSRRRLRVQANLHSKSQCQQRLRLLHKPFRVKVSMFASSPMPLSGKIIFTFSSSQIGVSIDM